METKFIERGKYKGEIIANTDTEYVGDLELME